MQAVEGIATRAETVGPLIVCGMHRSGTSLLASLLEGAGLHMGDDLLEPSASNRRGHFEDVGILDFHRAVLVANGIVSEGYTTQEHVAIPERLEPEAARLVASRTRAGRPWGWKEPRTTLFLDFWADVLPDARYLLVFRRPWEVVDSLLRRNEATFHWNPAFALDVWAHYNKKLLDFARRHPDATLVCEATQVTDAPGRLFADLHGKFALPLGEPPDRYDPALLRQDVSPAQPALLAAACPRAYDLYLELRDLAGSGSPLPRFNRNGGDAVDLQEHVFTVWRQATQHMLRCEEAEHRLQEIERARAARRKNRWRRLLGFGRQRTKAA